jgi:hypothetical protein
VAQWSSRDLSRAWTQQLNTSPPRYQKRHMLQADGAISTSSREHWRHATRGGLLDAMFSVVSVTRPCNKDDVLPVSREVGASQRGPEAWDTEAEESTTLWAVARRKPVKTADWEVLVPAVVNCRVFELALALQLLIGRSVSVHYIQLAMQIPCVVT